jgi:hypothetical protein
MAEASPTLEYSRRLYDNVLFWNASAERKAQVILTIDAVFLSVLSASLTSNAGQLRGTVKAFTPLTWTFLALMLIFLVGSLMSVVWVMHSIPKTPPLPEGYVPERMWFFKLIATLPDRDRFRAEIHRQAGDESFEIDALLSQVHIISELVSRRHRWVNYAFASTATALLMFAAATASYLVALA